MLRISHWKAKKTKFKEKGIDEEVQDESTNVLDEARIEERTDSRIDRCMIASANADPGVA